MYFLVSYLKRACWGSCDRDCGQIWPPTSLPDRIFVSRVQFDCLLLTPIIFSYHHFMVLTTTNNTNNWLGVPKLSDSTICFRYTFTLYIIATDALNEYNNTSMITKLFRRNVFGLKTTNLITYSKLKSKKVHDPGSRLVSGWRKVSLGNLERMWNFDTRRREKLLKATLMGY